MKTKDINNKNANGDINRSANGDINRLANGDINRLADGDENPSEGKNETEVTKEITDDTPATVVEVSDGSLKDKILMKTNNVGLTQDGKLTKTFAWGAVTGLLLVILYGYAKRKGVFNKFMRK